MNNAYKKLSAGMLLAVVIYSLIYTQTWASWSDFNPLNFLNKAADLIERRASDLIYYLVMQKKYIFDNYEDPNNIISVKVPDEIEKLVTSTNSSIPNKKITTSVNSVSATSTSFANNKVDTVTNLLVPINVVPINTDIPISNPAQTTKVNTNYSPILTLTNRERADNKLMPLGSNSVLDQIASLRADDIFDNQYFEHESLDGKTASSLANKLGYGYSLVGENLAMGNFLDDQEIVTAWMESPGHRANILNGKFKELGVVVKEGIFDGSKTTIAVQIFATPLASCPKPNQNTKNLIDSSSLSIKQMQKEKLIMYNNLNAIKNTPGVDLSYYNQKVQEYNYFNKKINDSVLAVKNMIDLYNIEVSNYNLCIKN
jgi:uncharacterized protein YkwD